MNGASLNQHLVTLKHRRNISDPEVNHYRNVNLIEPEVYEEYLADNKDE
jgi:hypothetical protein